MRFAKSETYASYWYLSLYSYLGKRGDSYDRFLIRIREIYESVNIVFQIINNLLNTNNESNNFFFFFRVFI
jgi:NADH:ubiquinone oxidoreductase subunit D